MILTQEELKKQLHYDPNTGIFYRKIRSSNSVNIGDIAGCVVYRKTNRYITICVLRKDHYAHRLAWLYMTGKFPDNEIDHINGDGSDNRWTNLRDVTRQNNMRNVKVLNNNTSGITGVYWNKQLGCWAVQIKVNMKQISLGTFGNMFDAACARKSAELFYGFHENHGNERHAI